MTEAPQRRLQLVTDAAYSHNAAARSDTGDDVAPETRIGETPASNGSLLRLRSRWSSPPMVVVRVAFAVIALALVAATAIAWSRPSGSPGSEPELAWPDPPPDWAGDGPAGRAGEGNSQAGSGGEDGVRAGSTGESWPAGPLDDGRVEESRIGAGANDGDTSQGHGGDGTVGPAGEHVVVHVAGQVVDPGVVELPAGSRVHEALDASGGSTPDAALENINLAATLSDGQQLYVPALGEEPREQIPGSSGPAGQGEGAPGSPDPHGPPALVDLNSADETTLQTLPGIGPAMAGRIIEHRTANGPFTTVDQLSAVSGIGPATLTRLRDLVTV